MKTCKPYTFNHQDFGPITVPAGIRVTHQTACGIDENYHFVGEFKWIKENYPEIDRVLLHDATYRGFNIPKEFIIK